MIRRARLALLLSALAGVSFFALSPLPLTEQVVSWQDKVEHVLAFLVLTLLSLGLWRARWLLAGWAAFAGFIELGQSFMPGRTASWDDWLASTGLTLNDGFIAIGPTLQSSDPVIFAAGDCVHMPFAPRPKAGVFAVRAAPILVHNLWNLSVHAAHL